MHGRVNGWLTGAAWVTVLYFNVHTKLAVVRCAREYCKLVESSLVFVTELVAQELRLRVARVCGTSCKRHGTRCAFAMSLRELTGLNVVICRLQSDLPRPPAQVLHGAR